MWAVSSRSSSYLRFAVPSLVLIGSWYVLTQLASWGMGEPASAGWALALAVQMLVIVAVMVPYRYVQNVRNADQAQGDRTNQRYPTYNLLTLILWGTVVACGLTFVRFGRSQWGWSVSVVEWEFFKAMPLEGLYNALFALLWLWVFATGGWARTLVKAGIASSLIVSLAVSQPYVIGLLAGAQPLTPRDFLILAGGHSGLLVVSLTAVFFGRSIRAPKGSRRGNIGRGQSRPSLEDNGKDRWQQRPDTIGDGLPFRGTAAERDAIPKAGWTKGYLTRWF